MLLRVALTGGIATGKSFCLARFAALGVPVVDADVLAREVVAPGTPALDAVRARFGDSMIKADGALDRTALGRLVFGDRAARSDLEAIVHPAVYRRIGEWFTTLPPATRLAMADIPLLFETGHAPDFDRIVVCACNPAEQLRRLMLRDRLSEPDARARLAAQWPIQEKVARADYVIQTDGSMADTEAGVRTVYERLKAEG
jgi:dephospho-CoA kinase